MPILLSNNIIYKKNINKSNKVVIFYDSFLLKIMAIYLEMFEEVFMIKTNYSNHIINKINPDYVFEFRVERFLN